MMTTASRVVGDIERLCIVIHEANIVTAAQTVVQKMTRMSMPLMHPILLSRVKVFAWRNLTLTGTLGYRKWAFNLHPQALWRSLIYELAELLYPQRKSGSSSRATIIYHTFNLGM